MAQHTACLLRRHAQPLVRAAGPALEDLRASTPDLTSSAGSLNYFFNELAYNPRLELAPP